jgi:hypothetical protein
MYPQAPSGASPSRDAGNLRLRDAEGCQALARLTRNQGFESRSDHSSLLLDAGCFAGAFERRIVDDQGWSSRILLCTGCRERAVCSDFLMNAQKRARK